MDSSVKAVYIAESGGAPMREIAHAELVVGRGIAGDRYFSDSGTFSVKLKDLPDSELTLIESEQVDQFNAGHGTRLDYGAFRRNIITAGVRLEDFIGREFTIGDVRLRGIRLCEPCAHLAQLLGPEVLRDMVHRAGLRAAILTPGVVSAGDMIASISNQAVD